jgi:hypothetical protein
MCVDTIFIETKNRFVRLANGARIEQKSTWITCHHRPSFSDLRRRKKEPYIRILAGFEVPFGVNYMAESSSIKQALVAQRRGANLPYFGKQGNIMPYSPREQKRKPIQGLPGVSDME